MCSSDLAKTHSDLKSGSSIVRDRRLLVDDNVTEESKLVFKPSEVMIQNQAVSKELYRPVSPIIFTPLENLYRTLYGKSTGCFPNVNIWLILGLLDFLTGFTFLLKIHTNVTQGS